MKVLVAAASKSIRKIYRSILTQEGHILDDIHDAEKKEEVVSWLAGSGSETGLVVADWDLPGMDGLSLMKHLQKTRTPRSVGVLFVINAPQRSMAEEAIRLGARGFVVRPFQDEDLRNKIREIGTVPKPELAEKTSIVSPAKGLTALEEAELPFLIQLPSSLLSEFLKLAEVVRHVTGSTLIRAGELVNELHVLTSGEVEVIDSGDSASRILSAGECFSELAFLKEVPSPVMVRARTSVQVALLTRYALGRLASLHPELVSYLAARAARAVAPQKRDPSLDSQGAIYGDLKSLAFSDLIQFLQTSGKTGVLTLKARFGEAEIHLRAGEVRHAKVGYLEGEKAFYQLALLTSGTFSFTSLEGIRAPTISLPTTTLLMEAMRLADEVRRGGRS